MEYSMEFHGTLVPPNYISLSSMEFHGTFHGIPWNFGAVKWSITYFHGIPWNFEIAILWHFTLAEFPRDIPWNSMELWSRQIKKITEFHGIPWNWEGAITNDTGVPWNSMEYSVEFHGALVPPNEISISSMEFHGIFHGIPWNSGAAKWHIT